MNHLTYFARLDELYKFQLREIENIKFTKREIDIIACIMHNKGEKKIAGILAISHRTVGTHLHNIMLKLEVGSRDLVINFIEKSGKSKLIDEYYFNLNVLMIFEKELQIIGKNHKSNPINIVLHDTPELSKKICIKNLKQHLKFANITICNDNTKEKSINIHCILKSDDLQKNKEESIFLKINNDIEYKHTKPERIIDFTNKADYYTSLLTLIALVHNEKKIATKVIKTFKNNIQNLTLNFSGVPNTSTKSFYSELLSKKVLYGVIITLLIACLIFLIKNAQIITSNVQIRYDLALPHENFLLKREDILDQIESVLNQNDIGVVALVGIGGSGKTILARNYAKKHRGGLLWEINAETDKTLLASFEQLAYSISEDINDKHRLRNIQLITDLSEKRNKLRIFITTHIKKYDDWFLIYDNVNDFSDVIDFFPHDKQIWGKGKIIITTRDSNITNNNFITENNVIKIHDLNNSEKTNLFKKIIGTSKNKSSFEDKDFDLFIKQMPPFPLDIVTAASYIKNTGTSFSEYIKNISYPTDYFDQAQMGFLRSIGHYNNTRYGIIALSIKQLVDENRDFRDLILLVSLLKNQNIPRNLLVYYKNEIKVRNFLHKIRMYSFLSADKNEMNNSFNSFGIHQTVQNITYNYLKKSITKQEYDDILKSQAKIISNYLIKEANNNLEFSKIKVLERHAEKFLNTTSSNLKNKDKVNLEIELANYYLKTTKFYKAKRLLKKCADTVDTIYGKESIEKSKILHLLGVIYYNLSEYDKARTSLEKSIRINKKLFGGGAIKFTESLFYLAMVESDVGQHFKAIKLLEPVSTIIQSHYGDNHVKTACVMMYLAKALYRIGEYDRSENLLKKSSEIYTNNFGSNHPTVAKNLLILGSIYRQKGYYNEALDFLNKALKIRNHEYGEDNVLVAETKVKLALLYRHLGQYDMATDLLKNAISIYKEKYGINNKDTAWAMTYLGHVLWDNGKIDDSIRLLTQASGILIEKHGEKNLYTSWCFLRLGYVLTYAGNYDKAKNFIKKGYAEYGKYYKYPHIEKAWSEVYLGNFYNKTNELSLAQTHLERALKIYQNQFGENHIRTSWIKKVLADNYSRQGDFAKALKLIKEAYTSYRLHYGESC